MPPSLSWTDRDELARLASRLQSRQPGQRPADAADTSRVRFPLSGTRARRSSSATLRPPVRTLSSETPGDPPPPQTREEPTETPAPPARPLPPPGYAGPGVRLAKLPTSSNSSASWQRPSFKSVEIDVASLGLDLDEARAALAVSPQPSAPPPPRKTTSSASTASVKVATPLAASDSEDDDGPALTPLSGGRVTPTRSLVASLQGSFEEKLEIFTHWLMGSTGAYAAFVADGDGLEVANRHATEDLLAVTALIDRQMAEARRLLQMDCEGSVSVCLDEENVLHVVWVDTERSRFAVGLVLADSLSGSLVHAIRKTFRAVAAP